MSLYSELVDTWVRARADSLVYTREHRDFANRLVSALAQALEIPRECWAYCPIEGATVPNRSYSIVEASEFGGDKRFHVRFSVWFQEGPRTFPILPAVFELCIRRTDATWSVATYADGPVHDVEDTEDGHARYARAFVEEVRPWLARRVRDDVEGEGVEKRIGFRLPTIES